MSMYRHGVQQRNVQLLVHDSHSVTQQGQQDTKACCCNMCVAVCRYGSGLGSLGLMVVPLMCSMFCGNACVTANSR